MTAIVPRIIELKGDDPESAFIEAQREARHYYGNNGRTGTIADSEGPIVVEGPPLLMWDARRTAQQMLRDGHAKPGGHVFLIKVADPVRSRTVKVPVDITGLQPGQADDAIDSAVRTKLPSEQHGISYVELRHADADGEDRKGTLKTKTVLTAIPGKKITKYVVVSREGGQRLIALDSLPEAKAWMKEALEANAGPMDCVAVTQKEGGPLLIGENRVIKRTVVAVATIGTPATAGNGTFLAAGIFSTE